MTCSNNVFVNSGTTTVEVKMNYAVNGEKFCGLDPQTTEICGSITEACQAIYNHNTKVLSFSGNGGMRNYDPEATTWYQKKDIIGTVSITGITSIGNNALMGLTQFTTLSIPKSVATIGENAFKGCTGITDVVYPAKTTAPSNAFFGCTSFAVR